MTSTMIVAGLACNFHSVCRIDRIRFRCGAFDRAIGRRDIVLCSRHPLEHRNQTRFASSRAGTLRLSSDDVGLWFAARLPDSDAGWLAVRKIEDGVLRGVAIGAAIRDLVRVQNAFEKTLPEAFQRSFDACDLRDIHAQAEDHIVTALCESALDEQANSN